MVKKIELLAPAGSSEALHAAVENGADAVYLGGKLFNARQQADNFDMDVLKESLAYAHARGVSIYLTMNTLVSDDEMKQALIFAAEAREAGIDGIIVQDLGLAGALHRVIPDVPLHGSTQMTIYDMEGVRALENMGFKRVVLARELTLQEASEIARNTQLEVEVFVHGALCVCYSGQCLMSSMIGGRSGNRGRCAQPCRLPYSLDGSLHSGQKSQYISGDSRFGHNDKSFKDSCCIHNRLNHDGIRNAQYLLSPKDMCSLEHIGEIVDSGIRSLKIEGRMKSPEYVATVVRIYRKYLDLAQGQVKTLTQSQTQTRAQGQADEGSCVKPDIAKTDMHDLLQIFNRGGFSSGYLKGKTGIDMMSFEKPNNSGIYLGNVIAYDERSQTISIKLEDRLSVGDGVEIWTGGFNSPGGIVTSISKGDILQRIRNTTYSREVCPISFSKGSASLKTAGKGEVVAIGSFRGRILPGQGIYKTSDTELNKAACESFTGKNVKRVAIRGQAILKTGQPLMLKVEDHDGHIMSAAGTVLPEQAINKSLTEERLKDQLNRTGSTPFIFAELQIELEDGLSLPVSEINEVRRQALESLQKLRADRYAGLRRSDGISERIDQELRNIYAGSSDRRSEIVKHNTKKQATGVSVAEKMTTDVLNAEEQQTSVSVITASTSGIEKVAAMHATGPAVPAISLYFYKWDHNIDYSNLGADRLYLPFTAFGKPGFRDTASALRDKRVEVFGWLPPVTRGNCEKLIDKFVNGIDTLLESGFGIDGILAGNIGTAHRIREMYLNKGINGLRLAGDISMNLFNTLSIQEAAKMGLESVALSIEMTLQQIVELTNVNALPIIETAVYGRLPLMTSEYCPVGCVEGGFKASSSCSGSCGKGDYKLQDRLGVEFPVFCDRLDCRSTILNSNVLFIPDSLKNLRTAGAGIFRLYIWDETPDVIKELIQLYRAASLGDSKAAAVHSGLVEKIKATGFTKGHYYRGV